MSDGVIVQESRRGKLRLCAVWQPLVVGRDPSAGFRLRDRALLERHLELTAEFDGRVRVRVLEGARAAINDAPVEREAHASPGDVVRLAPKVALTVLGALDPAAPTRERGALRLPQRLSERYLLLRGIGRGSAGVVYEGYDLEQDRRVAIKLLVAGGRAAPELIERFRREAALQAQLRDYPGIVSVWDHGTVPDSGELYAVMEYVTGTTLRQRVRDGLPRLDGVRLMARVARAAAYAHDHGLIHRDLKPGNVMVSEQGTVRLTDFGLCKALEDQDGMTVTGVLLGTPSYMAPEQIEDAKRVGPAADVYALGAMLYVVLTRRLPFDGETLSAILDGVIAGAIVPPRQADPTIEPELEAMCLKAMSRLPEDRTPSALHLAKALEAWVRRVDPPKRVSLGLPGSPPPQR